MQSEEALERARYAASRHNSIGWRTVKALLEIIDAQAEELEEDAKVMNLLRRQRDEAESVAFELNNTLEIARDEFRDLWNGVQA